MKFETITREEIKKNGFPNPLPASEEVLNSMPEDLLTFLQNVTPLVDAEVVACEKVNAKRPTKSGILAVPGGLTVCEDEDDWKIIAAKEFQELNSARKNIATWLSEALDKGLGRMGLIQRQCKEYGVAA